MNPNEYPVYPEDDGYDTPKNPFSPVQLTSQDKYAIIAYDT